MPSHRAEYARRFWSLSLRRFEQEIDDRFRGAGGSVTVGVDFLVHYNLPMRPSGCNWEQVKSLKRRENRRALTGPVGLANRTAFLTDPS